MGQPVLSNVMYFTKIVIISDLITEYYFLIELCHDEKPPLHARHARRSGYRAAMARPGLFSLFNQFKETTYFLLVKRLTYIVALDLFFIAFLEYLYFYTSLVFFTSAGLAEITR